jgi:hypothetical protein
MLFFLITAQQTTVFCLRTNAGTFKWENQLQFAKKIAGTVFWLHHNEVVHGDIVSMVVFHFGRFLYVTELTRSFLRIPTIS